MRRLNTKLALTLFAASPFLIVACSSNPPSPGGTGGISAGGSPGTGGIGAGTGGIGTGTGGIGTGTGGIGTGTGGTGIGGTGTGGISTGTGGGSGGSVPDGVYVDLAAQRQIIRGFGLNTTIVIAGATIPWNQLFTLEGANAIGLSILRIGMNENGGHRDVPSDWETARDLGAKIIGSCWSAPGAWKDNGSPTAGGHLEVEYYEQWATRIATYANEHDLYAMSVGNETDFASCGGGVACSAPLTDEYESMVYTGKELADFVEIAGPIFEDIAPTTQMIAPEASLWIHVWSNLSPTGVGVPGAGYESSDPLGCNCFSNDINDAAALATCDAKCVTGEDGYDYGHWLAKNPAAWSAFDILGVHEYESQVGYPWPADVNGGVRDKEVWQTEMSGVMYWPEQGPSLDINNGVAVAGWIHSALTVGEASAWLYWWYEAYYQNDNEGLALLKNRDGVSNPTGIAKRYYALGNYSKFVRPDTFYAVAMGGNANPDVLLSAYKGVEGDAGKVVVVAINKGSAEVTIPITITGGTAPATLTPTVTSATQDLVDGTPVDVTGGVLSATLPGMSVTTFH